MTITPDRLNLLDELHLDVGSHRSYDEGHCAMEVVAWLAGEGITDAPACASPVLCRYTIALNDRWNDERRQTLKPYLPRMVGTADDGKDPARERIAAEYIATRLLGPWLRLAGLDAEAEALEAADYTDVDEVRRLVRAARDAAWAVRRTRYDEIRAKVREHLANKPAAVAAADAVAVAVAAAVADAVADAVAAAAADAVAVAVAVAAADAVAVAVAAADAGVAAAADAAADAVAVAAAAADAVADADPWGRPYSAGYQAARKYFNEHPPAIGQQVADLAAEQQPLALELLDRLIDAEAAA